MHAHQVPADRFAPALATASAPGTAGRLWERQITGVHSADGLDPGVAGDVELVVFDGAICVGGRSDVCPRDGPRASNRAETDRSSFALRHVLAVGTRACRVRLTRSRLTARRRVRRGRRTAVAYPGALSSC